MPTRFPFASTSAPPELPGLIAASVWMKFANELAASISRPSALTIPIVTVCPTLKGLPIASTMSPTRSDSDCPKVMGVSPWTLTRTTARSVSWSIPTVFAGTLRPSGSVTSISLTPSTMWSLVRM